MIGKNITCSLDVKTNNSAHSLQCWANINGTLVGGSYISIGLLDSFRNIAITRTIEEDTSLIYFRIVLSRSENSEMIIDNVKITLSS